MKIRKLTRHVRAADREAAIADATRAALRDGLAVVGLASCDRTVSDQAWRVVLIVREKA